MGPKTKGQAALILILLTAAALIFLAVTLNWGHIAQTKALVTVAADEAATLLASDPASYGEMEKQTNLKDTNQVVAHTSVFLAIIMVVVAIIVAIIAWPAGGWVLALALVSVAMSVVNLVLQVVVVQPGITSLWNKLQKNQPVQQQFFEQGMATALEAVVTDQMSITDYMDSNANGIYGLSPSGFPKDKVGRFAFYYTDRLKMLNQGPIPQVVFFYNQLNEFMNGESCAQNENDAFNYPSLFSVNPACLSLNSSPVHCVGALTDPACEAKIPGGFQLNDQCADSNPAGATYNPYCDPCCQPLNDPNGKLMRPIYPYGNCTTDVSALGAPPQCYSNNPYNFGGINSSQFTLLYDPSYQEYSNQVSFLDQFGRDQQIGPFNGGLLPMGNFPNGIYPFFYLMDDYSPEVDNINPTVTPLQPSQDHWCTTAVAPLFTAPPGYPTLTQLGTTPYTLPFSCVGQDCCVNYLGSPAVGAMDMVEAPSFPYTPPSSSNPGLDTSFGESGAVPASSWLQGDNQLCSTAWPYNGENPALYPDGTCEWTGSTAAPVTPPAVPVIPGTSSVDGLDDVMHTLSDFVVFSNTLLGNDIGTLSSTFDLWYPQAAGWTDPNFNGRLLNIYNPPGDVLPPVDVLNQWENIISNWLNVSYTSPGATNATVWCVPTEMSLLNGNPTTLEDSYITTNTPPLSCGDGSACYSGFCKDGTACSIWGDLPHVLACLNYNAAPLSAGLGTTYNYKQCQAWLASGSGPACCDDTSACGSGGPGLCSDGTTCPSTLVGTPCDPSSLGRSLVPGPVPVFDGCAGTYKAWVDLNVTTATDEAPKFALRSAYLTDLYKRARKMQDLFYQGDQALHSFLAPCAGDNCSSGGPAAQLAYAYGQDVSGNSTTAALPNAVIYGWQDGAPSGSAGGCTDSSGSKVGCAHLVKVTAYSVGRAGSAGGINALLPWIQTKTSGFLATTRSFTLTDRDGAVYVSVKRWDQDHGPISFPNKHTLWQSLFHNPNAPASSSMVSGLSPACIGLNNSTIGFGLMPQTVLALTYTNPVTGLSYANSTPDEIALGQAFMLNDEGNGKVDPSALGGSSVGGSYTGCLQWANSMLCSGQESHACVRYIASLNASHDPSGNGDNDYSLKFVSCGGIPDDLTGGTGC